MTTTAGDAGATATTTAAPQPESPSRIAIWSLSARVIGAYFVIFLLQYVPGVALEAYTHWPPPSEGAMAVARAALAIVKGSGPIGIGSATNALAIAMIVEASMVLARIISAHQREEGFRQGVQQGVRQERKRSNAKLRALAKKYGIPEEDLPIADTGDNDDEPANAP